MSGGELRRRVVVAAVGIPAALGIVYWGRWVLGVVLAALAAAGAVEVARLVRRKGLRPFTGPSALAAAAFVLVATAHPAPGAAAAWLWLIVLTLLIGTAVASVWLRGAGGQPVGSVAATLLGALYPGATLAYALFLRHLPEASRAGGGLAPGESDAWLGAALLLFPIAVTWVNDSCAYFGGHAWGRRRLIPSVSPNKTVAGAVAGVVGSVVAGALFAGVAFVMLLDGPFGAGWGALGGALIGAVAQVGDLVESVFKRDAGVKDSGRLFPGHGGVLDRFDALFLTVPFAYLYVIAVIGLTDGGGAAWP